MTAAAKRLSKLLVIAGALAVFGTGCFGGPPAGVASEPASTAALPSTAGTPAVTRIISDLSDATIGRYGTRTRATFRVVADGVKLRYTWQHRTSAGAWKTIPGAGSAEFTAKATAWRTGTRFRVLVTGKSGDAVSATAKLTVLFPTRTPARDAEAAFGLTGLRQGVDLSAYQYTPSGRVRAAAIAEWAGRGGFTLLRNGSGARPVRQRYTSACTNATRSTGARPAVEDCAYRVLADRMQAAGLSLGHYWFNGWISSIDTTKAELFAGGYTPASSARQFVAWLKADGNYTKASTDPLVLDVEKGSAWTKSSRGRTYRVRLRAWNPGEAAQFLSTVRTLLVRDGYHANLYVYLSANVASRVDAETGSFRWTPVAGIARLWVAAWGTNNGRIPDAQPNVGPWEAHGGWSIWQYTSNARIPGDGVGGIDADIAKPDAWTPR